MARTKGAKNKKKKCGGLGDWTEFGGEVNFVQVENECPRCGRCSHCGRRDESVTTTFTS